MDKQQAIIEQCNAMEKTILETGIDDSIFEGDWEWVELGDIAEINPPREDVPGDLEVSFIRMEYISEISNSIESMDIVLFKEIKGTYTFFKENDVLFAKITPCMENGKIAIAKNLKNGIGFGSTEFHVIRPSKKILSQYIHYWLLRPTCRIAAQASFTGSSGHRRVPEHFLKHLKTPLPPLEKQQEIVDFLNVQFETLANIRRLKENAKQTIKMILDREVFGE